ncbi:MAG: hypothetical protein AABY01_04845 [Nanoarchaeota archaeon]
MDERRKQLKKDMESYISTRRKSDWSFTKPFHPTIQEYKPKQEESAVENTEVTEKKGWFSKVSSKIFGEAADEATEDVPAAQVHSQISSSETHTDLKELARISLGVMKQMPGEQIHEFKQSPDYDKFKTILKKHNLIK